MDRPPFDLVLLDMLLKDDEDGLEIYERIRRLVPTQKAILVSGHAPTDRVEAAVGRGLPWLQKPYSPECLAKVVDATLHGSNALMAHMSSLVPPRSSSMPRA